MEESKIARCRLVNVENTLRKDPGALLEEKVSRMGLSCPLSFEIFFEITLKYSIMFRIDRAHPINFGNHKVVEDRGADRSCVLCLCHMMPECRPAEFGSKV